MPATPVAKIAACHVTFPPSSSSSLPHVTVSAPVNLIVSPAFVVPPFDVSTFVTVGWPGEDAVSCAANVPKRPTYSVSSRATSVPLVGIVIEKVPFTAKFLIEFLGYMIIQIIKVV